MSSRESFPSSEHRRCGRASAARIGAVDILVGVFEVDGREAGP